MPKYSDFTCLQLHKQLSLSKSIILDRADNAALVQQERTSQQTLSEKMVEGGCPMPEVKAPRTPHETLKTDNGKPSRG